MRKMYTFMEIIILLKFAANLTDFASESTVTDEYAVLLCKMKIDLECLFFRE